jgi:hypothetical protein
MGKSTSEFGTHESVSIVRQRGRMSGLEIFIAFWLVSIFLAIAIIKFALDTSKTSAKLDTLIDEIRMLRREIKNSKHIIDKKI